MTAVSEKNDSPLVDTVRETVNELLSDAAEARMTRELSRSVKEAARTRDGWQQANEVGLPAVPQGNAVVACRRLLDSLKGIGPSSSKPAKSKASRETLAVTVQPG